tara:strand:- start:27 stop:476 length:450 start_codon:yes stop_codon:yes gene_type:complete
MDSANNPDYLKYWRVIRYFVKRQYNLTTGELEMLLFLNSEDIFSRDKFEEFEQLMPWSDDRFFKLKKQGWIELFRPKTSRRKPLYQLSYKTNRLISSVYKKLNGQEIPVTSKRNKLFAKNVKYTDKVYRRMIKDMNKSIRQQRHPSPGL